MPADPPAVDAAMLNALLPVRRAPPLLLLLPPFFADFRFFFFCCRPAAQLILLMPPSRLRYSADIIFSEADIISLESLVLPCHAIYADADDGFAFAAMLR